jgi:hypothetical protein
MSLLNIFEFYISLYACKDLRCRKMQQNEYAYLFSCHHSEYSCRVYATRSFTWGLEIFESNATNKNIYFLSKAVLIQKSKHAKGK